MSITKRDKIMKLVEKLKAFTEYCNEFYNENTGIYPIATRDEIEEAIFEYVTKPKTLSLDFDTIDRENVREIIGK